MLLMDSEATLETFRSVSFASIVFGLIGTFFLNTIPSSDNTIPVVEGMIFGFVTSFASTFTYPIIVKQHVLKRILELRSKRSLST